MGYSARYHVASLAAVFLALGVGILIGTGLGKNVVNDTTRNLESSLKSDLDSARSQVSTLRDQLHQQQAFAQGVYPALTAGGLRGDRIAVVALGGLDSSLSGDIKRVLGGAQNPTGSKIKEFSVIREPPDMATLNGEVRGTVFHPLRRSTADIERFGRAAARAIVDGGPLFRRVSGALLARRSGKPAQIDGVIVVRSQPDDLHGKAASATNDLETGLLDGLERSGVPVVGVERTGTDPSSIPLFRSHGLATVDNLDQTAGGVALVYALRGARGSFGQGPNATRLLPPLRRVRRLTSRPPASTQPQVTASAPHGQGSSTPSSAHR